MDKTLKDVLRDYGRRLYEEEQKMNTSRNYSAWDEMHRTGNGYMGWNGWVTLCDHEDPGDYDY